MSEADTDTQSRKFTMHSRLQLSIYKYFVNILLDYSKAIFNTIVKEFSRREWVKLA